ncbi:hypothetical protein ACFY2J_33705 [Streptomyces collinus]|uniref:hypothetical protein n=1 Tax=Streptomyces collinus TaxID=42684 RepID=UPI003681CB03
MPRGRHRHSPPLHRLLPPSAIAGVSAVCALGPWVFSEAAVLRALAAAAAATAIAGAFVMRRWDAHAGKQVADLTRARASDEWRFEERVAELETDLEESRELRTKLEQRLRAKRAELAGLRNEHASLLRRYATAETERASALEGRRLLEIEAAEPSGPPALPPARSAEPESADAAEATGATEADATDAEEKPGTRAAFSAAGARLFLDAAVALARLDRDSAAADAGGADADDADADGSEDAVAVEGAADSEVESVAESASGPEPEPAADAAAGRSGAQGADAEPAGSAPEPAADSASAARSASAAEPAPVTGTGTGTSGTEPGGDPGDGPGKRPAPEAAQEGEAQGKPGAAGGHEHAAASSTAPERPARSAGQQPSGHFTVPTAVAVVPAAPVRRPTVEGGFDFFGTQKETSSDALDAVQNEDLADVVGQEALALHKAETEAQFKPADEESRGVGQVIDLTAHDETEQIDVQGLRTAAS